MLHWRGAVQTLRTLCHLPPWPLCPAGRHAGRAFCLGARQQQRRLARAQRIHPAAQSAHSAGAVPQPLQQRVRGNLWLGAGGLAVHAWARCAGSHLNRCSGRRSSGHCLRPRAPDWISPASPAPPRHRGVQARRARPAEACKGLLAAGAGLCDRSGGQGPAGQPGHSGGPFLAPLPGAAVAAAACCRGTLSLRRGPAWRPCPETLHYYMPRPRCRPLSTWLSLLGPRAVPCSPASSLSAW